MESVRAVQVERERVLGECVDRLRAKERETESRRVGILSRKARELRAARKGLARLGSARLQTSAELMVQAELEAAQAERDALRARCGMPAEEEEDEEEQEKKADEVPANTPVQQEEEVEEAGEVEGEAPAAGSADTSTVREEGEAEKVEEEGEVRSPPTAEVVAKAREMYLQIIALEEKLQVR